VTPEETVRSRSFRCAAAARERDDPALGTAPYTRRWLLVEHPGPWPVDALSAPDISPEVRVLLTRTAAAHAARTLLIRRPGRTPDPAHRAWAVVSEDGQVTWGSWSSDEDLGDAAAILAAPPASVDGAAPAPPILLVCAHGLHDVCCALRGRPVAAALAKVWPEGTWECSHVGGDRFAANVVVLPDGVYYGNLNAHSAVASVRSHLAGEVPVDHLRGMTRVVPPAQVAIAAVHREYGPFAAGDVQVIGAEQQTGGVWRVELTTPQNRSSPIAATIATARRRSAQLTCRAAGETPATDYRVVELIPS
jgi:hypothetical protein